MADCNPKANEFRIKLMVKKKKILIIEDDLLACRAYQKRLEKAGYEVDCALDGEEGLAKSHKGYDLVILDIALPKLDGWQVLEQLKNHDETCHMPVVVCTVFDGEDYRAKAKEYKADGFVNKFHDDLFSEVERIWGV